MKWVRVFRRPRGADLDAYDNQVPGPWHAVSDSISGQTWCGSRLRSFNRQETTQPASDPRCAKCERAIALGQPRSWSKG